MSNIIKFDAGNGKELFLFELDGKIATIAPELMAFEGYANAKQSWNDLKKREDFEEGFEFKTIQGEELKIFKELLSSYDLFTLVSEKHTTLENQYKSVPRLDIVLEEGIFGVMYASNSGHANKFKKFMRREVNPVMSRESVYDPKLIEINKIEDSKERTITLRLYNIEKALLADSSDMLTQLNYNNTKQELATYKQSKRIDIFENKLTLIEDKVNRSVIVREGDCTAEAVAREFSIFSAASNKPHGKFAEHLAKELGFYITPDGNIGHQDEYVTVNVLQRGGVEVPVLKYSKHAVSLMRDLIENEGIDFDETEYWKRGENKGKLKRAKIAFSTGNIWVNETTYNIYK